MNRNDVFSSIKAIVKKEIRNEDVTIEEQMTALEIEGWDSLSHMSIIAAIEKQYEVSFSFMDIVNLEKVGDLVDLVLAKINIA